MKKLLSTFMKAKLIQAVFLCAGLLFSFSVVEGCGGTSAGEGNVQTVVSERSIAVEAVKGLVEVVIGSETIRPVAGEFLSSGQQVNVEREANITLLLDSDKHVFGAEETRFRIVALGKEGSTRTRIELILGTLVCGIDNKLGSDESFNITTPNASMSVRGTVFTTTVVNKGHGEYTTVLKVDQGSIETVTFEDGKEKKETVPAGETREFEGEAPEIKEEPEEIKAYRDERKDGDKRFEEYRDKNGILYPDQYDENGENIKFEIVRGTLVRFEEYFKEEYDHYMSLDGGVGYCADVFVFDEPMTMPDGSVVREVQAGFDDRGPGGNGRNIPRDREMEFIGNLDYVDNGAAWKRGGESDTTAYLDPIVFGDHSWHFYIYDYH